jgi:hypothetical protein
MTLDGTAAAIQARRAAEQKLQQVRDTITDPKQRKITVTYPAVARAAGVSRTFLYANPGAPALIGDAISKRQQTQGTGPGTGGDQEPSWRKRALNAEAALKTAQAEIAAQRHRMAILLGQICDLNTTCHRRQRNGWPPRTPRSSSASASSPTTTRPWKTGWKPPAPTTGSPTSASPSWKPGSPSAPRTSEAPRPAASRGARTKPVVRANR